MKLSPLQLVRYLMPEVTCVANPDYDPEKLRSFSDESFRSEGEIHRMEEEPKVKYSSWSVELDLSQRPDGSVNVPYHFQVKLVGLFRCSNAPADIPAEVFVKTNGSSIFIRDRT